MYTLQTYATAVPTRLQVLGRAAGGEKRNISFLIILVPPGGEKGYQTGLVLANS